MNKKSKFKTKNKKKNFYKKSLKKSNYNKDDLYYFIKDRNLLSQLYNFQNSYQDILVKYLPDHNRNNLEFIQFNKGFHYSQLNSLYNSYLKIFKTRENLLIKLGVDKLPNEVKFPVEGFARGVARYINKTLKPKIRISNAFVKLWEIYASIPELIPKKKNLKVFHIAEAPGQWIYCTQKYLKSRFNIDNYDWRANTLNPFNPINIKKYGNDILADDYGFLKKNPDRWIWGEDDTGDITKSENCQWYHNYVQEWISKNNSNVDLVTGDCGGPSEDPEIFQKIEFGQAFMVASVSTLGSNCVIKHFIGYNRKVPETNKATGQFISMIYLYYLMFEKVILMKPLSSNPNSGEFYLIGLNFHGLSNDNYQKIIGILDTFKKNSSIFSKDKIPEKFYLQVIGFLERLMNRIMECDQLQINLLECISSDSKLINQAEECQKILKSNLIEKEQGPRYQEWINKFKFKL